ncbi:MAG: hypothetical protein BV459_08255, partial [Thermoplasmata archaeon M11B2D]
TGWVNATDPPGSCLYTRRWYTFTTKENTNVPPNKPETPTGPTSGRINVLYTYYCNVTDPEGNQVWYWFEWGDGTNSGWIGPYDSGTTGSAEHAWSKKGSYNITVKAKDIYDAESVWSDPLPIAMPVEVNELQGVEVNQNPVAGESQENTIYPASSDVTETSSSAGYTPQPTEGDSTTRTVWDFIRLIIQIVRGEYPLMTFIEVLRAEGWIRSK